MSNQTMLTNIAAAIFNAEDKERLSPIVRHTNRRMKDLVATWHKVRENLEKALDESPGYVFEWSTLTTLVRVEEEVRLYHDIVAASSANPDMPIVTEEGIREVVKARAKRLLNAWDMPASTNPMADARSIIANEVNARFVTWQETDLTLHDVSR